LRLDAPTITLPKGGGAIRSIDEKFSVNPSNGTASLSMSLPLSPARNGFRPPVQVHYDSGAGNSVVGLGWSLDLPSIRRRTDRQLPRYRDTEDVFVIAGAEDLVPASTWTVDHWQPDAQTVGPFTVRRYRPRIEGEFARIEHIAAAGLGSWWRVTSRDNLTSFFGLDDGSRIVDPSAPERIFQWLPSLTFDDQGNCLVYAYKPEDLAGVPPTLSEANRRRGLAPFGNLHLKRLRYGNRTPYFADEAAPLPTGGARGRLPVRGRVRLRRARRADPDAGSTTRVDLAGTERRVLQPPRRLRSEDLPLAAAGAHVPPLRRAQRRHTHAGALARSRARVLVRRLAAGIGRDLPAFGHTVRLHPPRRRELRQADASAAGARVRDTRLARHHSNGRRRVGGQPARRRQQRLRMDRPPRRRHRRPVHRADRRLVLQGEPRRRRRGRSGPPRCHRAVLPKPSLSGVGDGSLQLRDRDANGHTQLVVHTRELQGVFDRDVDGGWLPFRPFDAMVRVDLDGPHVKQLDLDGDGRADLLVSEENAFLFHRADENGWQPAERAPKSWDEERSPQVVFAEEHQSIFLADMSGDGLVDIVRIRNGEVCYWPNLGYGRFGAKVAMDHAPVFAPADQFEPRYLHLADISGTGASDLLYLGPNGCTAYLNLSGNAWSSAQPIAPFFPTEQPNQVGVADLLGNGTACIVWSSPLPQHARAPMRYLDLMGGKKPHLLRRCINNMGKETSLSYKSSTWYYLKDKLEGRPWATRLAFPVHCLRQVEVREPHQRLPLRDRVSLPSRVLRSRRAGVPRVRAGGATRRRELRELGQGDARAHRRPNPVSDAGAHQDLVSHRWADRPRRDPGELPRRVLGPRDGAAGIHRRGRRDCAA
jgi:hypothetical protein